MRTWSLKAGDPCVLVLSADFRFCDPDYFNDHTWEIKTGTGGSNILEVQTNYGLRAHSMRIFPGFILEGKKVTDPEKFASPPRLKLFYPNFLQFGFSPFPGLDVTAEYWLPSSQTIACRMSFHNQTTRTLDLQYEVYGVMTPMEGQALGLTRLQSVNILSGKTSGLEPVVFLTGGALHGPGPGTSLLLDVKIAPLASRNFTWAQAALADAQASFELARRTTARAWDKEKARIMLTNASQVVEIETGDPDWDAALAFSQATALRLFFNSSDHLPHPSFVLARQPDQGYSPRGDGKDLVWSWNGQSIQDVSYMTSLLPGAPELAANLIRNFLSTQDATGFIDNQPGLVGQRSRQLAAPLLANLTLQVFRQNGDKEFLREAFPKLLSFLELWFDPRHDRDRDGFPEWDHPIQTGFEGYPAIQPLHQDEPVADIRYFESPALAACLYRECKSLITLAGELDLSIDVNALKARVESLLMSVNQCWNRKSSYYYNRDRDTHLSLRSQPILKKMGSGDFRIDRHLRHPVRLAFQVWGTRRDSREVILHIQGRTSGQPVSEKLVHNDFRWEQEMGFATSQFVYDSLEAILVTGLSPKTRLVVRSVDYMQEDLTNFLTLWAGIPSGKDAEGMIRQQLLNPQNFWHPAGISTVNLSKTKPAIPDDEVVQFSWNQLIGEGLLSYDMRSEAGLLVKRLMETAIRSLKQDGACYNSYRAKDGTGLGDLNTLRGLAPVGLFLHTLGVKILSAQSVHLEGINPFPWPVKIKYRGLTIVRNAGVTDITFPDGQTTRVTDTAACLVSMGSAKI